ncbi:hypothetical protein HDV00_001967 [Rhizophlyctis rosea]|nr:hypothetical protein HDV00_001967 [Rhizophlyctis rosea]
MSAFNIAVATSFISIMVFAFLENAFRRKSGKAECKDEGTQTSHGDAETRSSRRPTSAPFTSHLRTGQTHPPARSNKHDPSKKAWHDWLKNHVNWDSTMTIKDITIIRTHAWSIIHPEDKTDAQYTVAYLYHGTPSRNIKSITTTGFKDIKTGTWLAASPSTSVWYCWKDSFYSYKRGQTRKGKLILSCVVVQHGVDTVPARAAAVGSVVVVMKPSRVVPIAVIEFEGAF